jgi:hypothetical protein
MGCPGGYGPRAFRETPVSSLLDLVDVLVEAGILEPTKFGGYEVTIDVRALQKEVELLRRKVAKMETERMLGPQEPSSQ